MVDILIDSQNELAISNGDFDLGESTSQHQLLLLQSSKGDWRQSPATGVSLKEYLKEESPELILPEIKEQFELDGMNVNALTINNGSLNIDASYDE